MANQRRRDRRQTVRTEDPHEAEAVIAKAYLPNRVDRLGTAPLEFRLNALRLDSATIGLLSFGPETRLRTAEASDYHVNLPLRGEALSRMGGGVETAAVPGQAAVFMPGRPANILWGADAQQLCLMIPARTLEEELEQLLGRSVSAPLVFEDRDGPLHSGGTRMARLPGGGCGWSSRRVLDWCPSCAWPGSWSG